MRIRRKSFFLKVTLQNRICESPPAFGLFDRRGQMLLADLLKLLESAERHRRIKSILVVVKRVAAGWAQLEEVRSAIEQIRLAGKETHIYLEQADNKSYYLASAADKIYLPPSATLDFVGLSSETLFFRNLLSYLGIEPELFNIGDYKSAAEIFQREGMSRASREMIDSILSDLQGRLNAEVAKNRNVSTRQVQSWIDNGPFTAREAVAEQLIDGILYEDEIERQLKTGPPELVALPASKVKIGEGLLKRLVTFRRPQIAYIPAEGMITVGESRRRRGSANLLGASTLIEFLRDARRRKRVKAIVLRLNSPGGSGMASDLIWREVRITNKEKPVIVSFGDVAASGAFYVAAAGRKILASPSTITGSIGVIGGKFNVHKLMSKVGITVDTVSKGSHAGYTSLTRPFTKEEAMQIRAQLQNFYENLFLKRVAENRNRTVDEIRPLAEGRVWTGNQAFEQALIDEIGGIRDAIEAARQAASLERFRIIGYVQRRRLRDLLPGQILDALPDDGLLALMPEDLQIH